jgi:hypothetical protein
MPVIPACRRLRREDQELQTSLGYHSETLAKKKKRVWAGGVAQVLEHLPGKHVALNSNPRTNKNKTNKV